MLLLSYFRWAKDPAKLPSWNRCPQVSSGYDTALDVAWPHIQLKKQGYKHNRVGGIEQIWKNRVSNIVRFS